MRFLLLCLLLISGLSLSAQPGNPANSEASLQEQFDAMVAASNRYQKFRVVRQDFLSAYATNVSDSIRGYTDQIGALNKTIGAQEAELKSRASTIEARDASVASLEGEKDSISLLGIPLSKTIYSTILWAIIIGLLALMIFAFARTRMAVGETHRLEQANGKLTADLEQSRRRRLEIEQDLGRKLQDERNKRLKE